MSVAENQGSCFCLGTYILDPEETEPSSGRLLVFTAIPDSMKEPNLNLLMVTSTEVKGCVYALSIVGQNIVAAVNSAVSHLWYMLFPLGCYFIPCIGDALPCGDIE